MNVAVAKKTIETSMQVPVGMRFAELAIRKDGPSGPVVVCAEALERVLAHNGIALASVTDPVERIGLTVEASRALHRRAIDDGETLDLQQVKLLEELLAPSAPDALAVLPDRRRRIDRRTPSGHDTIGSPTSTQEREHVDGGAVISVLKITPPWSKVHTQIRVPADVSFADLGIRRDTLTGLFELDLAVVRKVLAVSKIFGSQEPKTGLTVDMLYAVVAGLSATCGIRDESVPSEQEEFVRSMETIRFAMLVLGQAMPAH